MLAPTAAVTLNLLTASFAPTTASLAAATASFNLLTTSLAAATTSLAHTTASLDLMTASARIIKNDEVCVLAIEMNGCNGVCLREKASAVIEREEAGATKLEHERLI